MDPLLSDIDLFLSNFFDESKMAHQSTQNVNENIPSEESTVQDTTEPLQPADNLSDLQFDTNEIFHFIASECDTNVNFDTSKLTDTVGNVTGVMADPSGPVAQPVIVMEGPIPPQTVEQLQQEPIINSTIDTSVINIDSFQPMELPLSTTAGVSQIYDLLPVNPNDVDQNIFSLDQTELFNFPDELDISSVIFTEEDEIGPGDVASPTEVFGENASGENTEENASSENTEDHVKKGRKRKLKDGPAPSRRRRPKKPKIYEIQEPLADKESERKRLNAINAKKHRDQQKADKSVLEYKLADVTTERDRLKKELDALKAREQGLVQQLQVYQQQQQIPVFVVSPQ